MNFQIAFFLSVFSLTLFSIGVLSAQDEPPPKPTPPFVVDAPAISGWTVTMNYKRGLPEPGDKGSPAYAQWQQWQKSSPAITELLVSKSGDRTRIIVKYAQGVQAERYRVGSFEYLHKPGYVAGDVSVNSHFQATGDFPELSWLSLDNYKDIESSDGKKYFVFREGTDAAPGREAWIDITTKLPGKFNDAMYERIYDFPESPPIGIEPSELIAKRVALSMPPR
jgi:hypothetical protein